MDTPHRLVALATEATYNLLATEATYNLITIPLSPCGPLLLYSYRLCAPSIRRHFLGKSFTDIAEQSHSWLVADKTINTTVIPTFN